jgi:hypothetical protein
MTDSNSSTNNDGGPKFTSHSRSDGGMLAPSLRILCLHDGNSNSGELSDQLEVLGERLYEKHMIDFVYVNAPLLFKAPPNNTGDDNDKDNANDNAHPLNPLNNNPQRIWWEEQTVHGDEKVEASEEAASSGEAPPEGKKFIGLDASLMLLRQIWSSMPFWGVLAVGQGAAVASFLPLLPVSPPPQLMIFVRGESLLEEAEFLVDSALSNSCLHLMAATPSESSERLLQQFGGRVFTGVTRNFTHKTLNVIGKVRRTWRGTGEGGDTSHLLV